MSASTSMIGSVFEELAQGDDLPHVDDATLVDAVTGWTRAQATVAFHRMAAIAELTTRRCASELAMGREMWACDGWDCAAAEIAAASGIGHRSASTQMHQGLALRHRLPQIAKLVAEGTLAAPLANTISWRTQLIDDPDILARVDADLAAIAGSFGPMSVTKLENAIDAAILVHDPAALRRFHTAAKSCDIKFGDRDDTTGTTTIWGRLTVTDAELVARCVDQLAATVCPHDPRSSGERRSAALGVLSARGTHLPCTCARPDCTAPGADARADAIVIHILTDQLPDPGPNAEPTPDNPAPGPGRGTAAQPTPAFETEPEPSDPEPQPETAPAPEPSDDQPQPEHRGTTSGLAVIV